MSGRDELEGLPLPGRTQFFLVVADGQGELEYDSVAGELLAVEPVDEMGFSLTRYEFPRYRYPKTAKGVEANKPVKSEDNAMDALKAAVARHKGSFQRKTEKELLEEVKNSMLPEKYRPENAVNLSPEERLVAAQAEYQARFEAKRLRAGRPNSGLNPYAARPARRVQRLGFAASQSEIKRSTNRLTVFLTLSRSPCPFSTSEKDFSHVGA